MRFKSNKTNIKINKNKIEFKIYETYKYCKIEYINYKHYNFIWIHVVDCSHITFVTLLYYMD